MSCYDMLMTVAPCNLVTIGSLLLAVLLCVTSFAQPAYITYRVMRMLGRILMPVSYTHLRTDTAPPANTATPTGWQVRP